VPLVNSAAVAGEFDGNAAQVGACVLALRTRISLGEKEREIGQRWKIPSWSYMDLDSDRLTVDSNPATSPMPSGDVLTGPSVRSISYQAPSMKRTANILFHVSGTGFVLAVALWGYILHVQKSVGPGSQYNPLEPALLIRILATSVVLATGLSVVATLLSYLSWARRRFLQRTSTVA
jgi:hypothetical protein